MLQEIFLEIIQSNVIFSSEIYVFFFKVFLLKFVCFIAFDIDMHLTDSFEIYLWDVSGLLRPSFARADCECWVDTVHDRLRIKMFVMSEMYSVGNKYSVFQFTWIFVPVSGSCWRRRFSCSGELMCMCFFCRKILNVPYWFKENILVADSGAARQVFSIVIYRVRQILFSIYHLSLACLVDNDKSVSFLQIVDLFSYFWKGKNLMAPKRRYHWQVVLRGA